MLQKKEGRGEKEKTKPDAVKNKFIFFISQFKMINFINLKDKRDNFFPSPLHIKFYEAITY
jgi:hypothetical protein